MSCGRPPSCGRRPSMSGRLRRNAEQRRGTSCSAWNPKEGDPVAPLHHLPVPESLKSLWPGGRPAHLARPGGGGSAAERRPPRWSSHHGCLPEKQRPALGRTERPSEQTRAAVESQRHPVKTNHSRGGRLGKQPFVLAETAFQEPTVRVPDRAIYGIYRPLRSAGHTSSAEVPRGRGRTTGPAEGTILRPGFPPLASRSRARGGSKALSRRDHAVDGSSGSSWPAWRVRGRGCPSRVCFEVGRCRPSGQGMKGDSPANPSPVPPLPASTGVRWRPPPEVSGTVSPSRPSRCQRASVSESATKMAVGRVKVPL